MNNIIWSTLWTTAESFAYIKVNVSYSVFRSYVKVRVLIRIPTGAPVWIEHAISSDRYESVETAVKPVLESSPLLSNGHNATW